MHKITVTVDQRATQRRADAAAKRDAMRDGVVLRAQTFRARKGAGSYRRRDKYPTRGD